jgi:predicted kinase
VLQARVRERRAHRDDPSEADLRVLEWQQSHFEPVLAEEALPLVEIRTDAPDAVERLLRFIETWRAAAFQYKG